MKKSTSQSLYYCFIFLSVFIIAAYSCSSPMNPENTTGVNQNRKQGVQNDSLLLWQINNRESVDSLTDSLNYIIELSKKVADSKPDTLLSLLKQTYNAYELDFMAAGHAENFEEGISKPIIMYPALRFWVHVFENAYAEKPYLVKAYSIIKDYNGNFTIK